MTIFPRVLRVYLCVCVNYILGVCTCAYVHVTFYVSFYLCMCVFMLCSILSGSWHSRGNRSAMAWFGHLVGVRISGWVTPAVIPVASYSVLVVNNSVKCPTVLTYVHIPRVCLAHHNEVVEGDFLRPPRGLVLLYWVVKCHQE